MKKICVYGGSGFLGVSLIHRLYQKYDCVITAVARDEGNLIKLKEEFPQINIISGDISDPWVVKKTMKGMDEVYLLSALKHVGVAEVDVRTCINTNIVGCMNIVNESIITKPKVLMFVSSDKAAQPNGVYGCSKKIAERLVNEAEKINTNTKYRTVRYGNVWMSTGSIGTKWIPKLVAGQEVVITDPEASRFFWTVDEAIDLIFDCIENGKDSTPMVPEMKAVKMGVVLEACMKVYGRSPIKTIGLQPGENKVETTDGITYSDTAPQFSVEEFIEKFLK